MLFIHSVLIIFDVFVNTLISEIWEEAKDGAATTRTTKLKAWLKRVTFYEILRGMKTTLMHVLHYQPITSQYPYEKLVLPDNYSGMLALLRYDDGTEKYVG
jgi:hypothetical protein